VADNIKDQLNFTVDIFRRSLQIE